MGAYEYAGYIWRMASASVRGGTAPLFDALLVPVSHHPV